MSDPVIDFINPLSDISYSHFDDDPDGDPDRAGDGIYYRIKGEAGWSGPWHSQEQAEGEAHRELYDLETTRTYGELLAAGFICVQENQENCRDTRWVKQINDRWFRISVSDYDVMLLEIYPHTGGFANFVWADLGHGMEARPEVKFDDDDFPVYPCGLVQKIVREAIHLAHNAPKRETTFQTATEKWADSRETGHAVAYEITAMATADRTRDDICANPTAAELALIKERLEMKLAKGTLETEGDFRLNGDDLFARPGMSIG